MDFRLRGKLKNMLSEITKYLLLIFLWLIFALTHSIFAAERVKKHFKKRFASVFKYYRLSYSLLATLILIFILLYNFSFHNDALWNTTVVEFFIAAFFGLPGLVVMIYCMRKYFFQLSGVDVFFQKKTIDRLQVDGINKYIRHPLYAGTISFALGCFFIYPGTANLISFIMPLYIYPDRDKI
jgi:protein-S-isoprenylcysteine O-methyltransferase Ste14